MAAGQDQPVWRDSREGGSEEQRGEGCTLQGTLQENVQIKRAVQTCEESRAWENKQNQTQRRYIELQQRRPASDFWETFLIAAELP